MSIVVLDFGGQYAHLIANRIRRLRVHAEIRSPETAVADLQDADGLILSGGPASVYDPEAPAYNPEILAMGKPMLGLCYGHQLLCHRLGGQVEMGTTHEFGAAYLHVHKAEGVLAGLDERERVWMSHRDHVAALPPGFAVLGATEDCPVAAMGDGERKIYGLQFHPEVTHTVRGMEILDNFAALCGAERNWTMERYTEQTIERLQEQAQGRNVFLFVSGGVDSSVAFLLLNRALGAERVLGLHIDNGFMREGETAMVERLMKGAGLHNLEVVDASAEFLAATEGIADPEEKRRRIGEEFIRVRDRALAALALDPDEWLLGQGTLYTDTIESGGTENAAVIKTHHNRVGVIDQLLAEGKVVEPLDQLYKDEARTLGETLGLPHHLVWRHPFPGPGLAVRALCSDGPSAEDLAPETVSEAQKVAATFGLALDVLPLRSVGVQGDSRTYAHPAVVTGQREWKTLEAISTELTNNFPWINRVIYLLGPTPRPQQNIKAGYLTRDRLNLLRRADAISMEALERHGLMEEVTQMPTVLLPLSSDGVQESVVLRPIATSDFMTARFCPLPQAFLDDVCERLLALAGIEAVFYDITHKPPGTVEWE
ncbi:MAG: glutamine-hydrolyzing GMP synthase [Gemmatimonadetes bacterium]|nr:glutamine-hydrolyzing GMP synthase [Gemmatimonadota bacterium]MYC72325.1 glutamine-hydrolyzing GMP synthase [Gemmatimonadota bacterium]MYI63396.1 glutamine-hydrolyzing GMP synthase [Gemmatimonadota bacterium]